MIGPDLKRFLSLSLHFSLTFWEALYVPVCDYNFEIEENKVDENEGVN